MEKSFALPGLSGPTNAEIARIELHNSKLYPGRTYEAFGFWKWFVRNPYRRLWDYEYEGCGHGGCCNDPREARSLLDAVAHRMTPYRAREFRALLRDLDDLY